MATALPSNPAIPQLSVVMPVHNALPFLDEAVESILGQSYGDFEFVIRDDGSTDGSRQALRQWAKRDSRIRLFEGEQLGPSGSSNWVVGEARAPLVARMDADDVAHPDRLKRQLQVMEAAPEIVLLGTTFRPIDADGLIVRPYDYSRITRNDFAAPFAHASILFRRDRFEAVGGYREECAYWEDLDLFLRMAARGRIGVLAEPLLSYRQAQTSTRLVSRAERVEQALHRRYQCMVAHRRTGDYSGVLETIASDRASRKLHPRTFVAAGSLQLWAGGAPASLAHVLKRADLRFGGDTAKVLGWAAWASVSPRSLRWSLNQIVRLRNLSAKKAVEPGAVYEWNARRNGARMILPSSASGRP
jgi:GT2 family glycosyltransferase